MTRIWLVALVIAGTLGSAILLFEFPIFSKSNGQQQAVPLPSKTHEILLIADESIARIAPKNDLYPNGIWYNVMTFNGTIPGPLIVANQGDILKVTLVNKGKLVHSLDFHAGFGPDQALSGAVKSGENKTWSMKVDNPGAFLYHCDGDNLNGIWEHIADGMYGGMVVQSTGDPPAKEFYVAFSEVYDTTVISPFAANQTLQNNKVQSGVGDFDMDKFIQRKPDLVLTNGLAFRYIPWIGTQTKIILNNNAEVFHAKTGELTRWYLFNAGPRDSIAFNFGAGLLTSVSYGNANDSGSNMPATEKEYRQSNSVVNIPPGSGSIIEVTFPEPGTYFGNDHDVGSILNGAGFVVMVE